MAKTLFKSSEKSNFILNLTEEQYAKFASLALLAGCFATSVAAAVPEINSSVSYTIAATGLTVSGVFGLIAAVIALLKKYIKGALIVPVVAFAGMLGFGVLSLVNGYDSDIGLYGFSQRGEGLMAILYYFGFFVTAASVRREKAAKALLYGIVGIGLLNALWAVIQIITEKYIFYSFAALSVAASVLSPAGLSQSPIFLSMLLTLSLTAAMAISMTEETKWLRIAAAASGSLFAFVMVFTRTFVGICGVFIGMAAGIIIVLARKKPTSRIIAVYAVFFATVLGIVLAGTVKNGTDNKSKFKYRLYDGYILWSADAYRKNSSSGNYNPSDVDIEDTYDVYTYLNNETIDIIKRYPLDGTGPEQLVYPQLYTRGDFTETAPVTDYIDLNSGTFDKCYNEYLYTAATRGIPSLLFMLAALFSTVFLGRKKLRSDNSDLSAVFFVLTLTGMLIFLIGCSNITFSPIFWACAGMTCARIVPEKKYARRAARRAAAAGQKVDEAPSEAEESK